MGASIFKKTKSSSFLLKAFQLREMGIVIAIVLVFGLALIKNSSFASTASIQQLLSGPSVVILLAVGETLVIITKNVDLSIGSVLGLSAYVVGDLFVHHQGMPIWIALLAGTFVGLLCGLFGYCDRFVDGGGGHVGGRTGPAGVFDLDDVLVPRQIAHVLFGRVARADGQRAQRRVRHVGRRHGELDVTEAGQRFGHLVVRRQVHAADERVRRVGACEDARIDQGSRSS